MKDERMFLREDATIRFEIEQIAEKRGEGVRFIVREALRQFVREYNNSRIRILDLESPTVPQPSNDIEFVAITQFKHAGLYEMLKRIGWTQAELVRQSGLSVHQVNVIFNLIRRPTIEEAEAIQKAFANKGEFFDVLTHWPEAFSGLNREIVHEQTLFGNPEALSIPVQEYIDTDLDTDHLGGVLEKIMSTLTDQEREVLKLRFWKNETLVECAKKLKISSASVGRREAAALRKMRRPENIKPLSIILHDELPPHNGVEQDLFEENITTS
jgi:RNA polymerase sigma factor (sigma-70 family)